jgi:putative DNA primase/helicase
VTAVQIWLECAADVSVRVDTCRAAIDAVAKTCRIHPIRDYLRGLPPGDPALLDTLAADWFGAPDPLDSELLRRFLVGAVRRIFHPGTQMDTMLVLYSRVQGMGKTQWVRSLFGPEWSSQQMPDLSTKDASQQIATVWGQELGELDKLLRTDPSTAKDYISRTVDTYRKPYGRDVVSKPRQCVFIGTTNEVEFLRDATGERRYWPIVVSKAIDQERVRSMRDLVWAAAVALAMRPGFEHWISHGTDWATQLEARQSGHAQEDAWHEVVSDYCTGRDFVVPRDVFRVAIMRSDPDYVQKWDRRVQLRIGDTLRRIGAEKGSKRIEGRMVKGFHVPAALRDAAPVTAPRPILSLVGTSLPMPVEAP